MLASERVGGIVKAEKDIVRRNYPSNRKKRGPDSTDSRMLKRGEKT
jgi:hypothetical protein